MKMECQSRSTHLSGEQASSNVLLMMGAMDARNVYSNLTVNEYLPTVASRWISAADTLWCSHNDEIA